MGRAILAAAAVVGKRRCHSLQATFVRRAQPQVATQLAVSEAMTGRNFSMRHVMATQGDREIFSATLSFREPHPGMVYQPPVSVPTFQPEDPAKGKDRLPLPPGIEARWNLDVDPDGVEGVWMRSSRALGDDPALQAAALVYASDYPILEAGMSRHGLSWQTPGLFTTSLNQSGWIMRTSDFSDWHFFSVDSPAASGGTAVGRASCFDRDGDLVAMFVQEAVIWPDLNPSA
jgi:acyl-CoA thioesterase II